MTGFGLTRPVLSYRLLVCGDRKWEDQNLILSVLTALRDRIEVVIEGEAPGADTMARLAAEQLGIKVEPYPADWTQYGRAAGAIRNTQMLVEGCPDYVIAFHDDIDASLGTANMVRQATAKGIQVTVMSHSNWTTAVLP